MPARRDKGVAMKQFGKILKFELMGYAKNKIFVGITLFLMVAISVVMFIPNIISVFDSDSGEDTSAPIDTPVMLVGSADSVISATVQPYFALAFPGYTVVISDEDAEGVKESIVSGKAECAFVMSSISSYTYYVNNLSMYDTNTAVADEVLKEVYRITAMVGSGISPEAAADILSVAIDGRTEALGKDQMENFFYTYIMIFALYMVILLYGQMVATNVATEKSSRAMELLVTSARPTSMMFGKVIASCLAGFIQLVLIFGTAMLLYNVNKSAFENPIIASIFDIPVDLFIFMIAFFVLGFLIYAFMFGAIGSTASKLEDINTSVMPITCLFIVAFIVVVFSMTSGSVDNTAMLICSYVPFTSPMAMFTRICMSTVMWYEILISMLILVASTVGIGFLSARIYRVGVLLYGMPPKLGTVIKTVFKKQ